MYTTVTNHKYQQQTNNKPTSFFTIVGGGKPNPYRLLDRLSFCLPLSVRALFAFVLQFQHRHCLHDCSLCVCVCLRVEIGKWRQMWIFACTNGCACVCECEWLRCREKLNCLDCDQHTSTGFSVLLFSPSFVLPFAVQIFSQPMQPLTWVLPYVEMVIQYSSWIPKPWITLWFITVHLLVRLFVSSCLE